MARAPGAESIVLPVFVAVSVGHLFSYLAGLWSSNRSSEMIQKLVLERLALSGNRIGLEFESEMRTAISRLHQWQQHAVRTAVVNYEGSISV